MPPYRAKTSTLFPGFSSNPSVTPTSTRPPGLPMQQPPACSIRHVLSASHPPITTLLPSCRVGGLKEPPSQRALPPPLHLPRPPELRRGSPKPYRGHGTTTHPSPMP